MFMVVMVYFLVAAASYNGFYKKHWFHDDEARYSLDLILDGRADRPFVYRQLLPGIANAVDQLLPRRLHDTLTATLTAPSKYHRHETRFGLRTGLADTKDYAIRYYIIYSTSFLMYFLSMFMMRRLCLLAGAPQVPATLAPILFSIFFPTLLAPGGYFYDFSEIFFFFLALCIVLGPHVWLMVPLAAAGTLNKEAYFFFLLTLAPLLVRGLKDRRGAAIFALSLCVSLATYAAVRSSYGGNPGGDTENHLRENIAFYIDPRNLFQTAIIYGIPMPAGYNVVTLGFLAIVTSAGWARLPPLFRRHALLAVAVNLPLLMMFAYRGEMRNMSITYPAVVLLMAFAITRWCDVETNAARNLTTT